MSWKDIKLGEFVTFRRGHDLPEQNRKKGDVPVIGSFGITGYHNKAKTQAPGVTLGRSGGSFGVATYTDIDFWPLNTALYVIDFHGNDEKFAYYFLKNMHFKSYNSGGAQPSLNRNVIHKIDIKVPPPLTQKRIAEILSNYDDLIENNDRRIALLEEAVHRLYREWFVRLRFPGHESVAIVDGIPEGWKQVTAQEITTFNPKTFAKKGEERPFLPMTSLSTNLMTVEEVQMRPVKGGAKFKNHDTLLARITPCLENGKTAFVQFLENNELVATGSTEFIVMRCKSVSPYWVYCLARSYEFRQHAINSMVGSDGRQRVKPDALEQFLTLKPDSKILSEFNDLVRPMFAKIQILSDANQKLKEARDSLLPRLMNGSIKV